MIWGRWIWLLAYASAIETFQGYRRYMKLEVGVTKETYWIRLSIVFLYVIGIFGLAILKLIIDGFSIFSIVVLHVLIFVLFLLYWYIDSKWR